MPERIFNFAAGPSTMPLSVLEHAKKEFINFENSGMALWEMSHRGKIYDRLHHETMDLLHEVYEIPRDTHKVLFLQGGATLQFAMVPMNFLTPDTFAQYVNTGTWATKAIKDAKFYGQVQVIASGEENGFMAIPKQFTVDPKAVYLHLTTNNTIKGSQWQSLPDSGNVPLVLDMSSDVMSRPMPWERIGLAYAGAQKNLAPAGMTLVILRNDMLAKASHNLPAYLRYDLHAEEDSLYNTPPTFPIYMMNLVLKEVKAKGGVRAMEKLAQERAAVIYDAIDSSGGYYRCPVAREDRSLMNICFRLPTEEMEAAFIAQAQKRDMSNLKGHRSVGGVRASTYNAMPMEGVKALAAFMEEFKAANPV